MTNTQTAQHHDSHDHNLRDVINIIPPHCYHNPGWKAAVYMVGDIFLYALCVTLLALTDNPLLLIPLWALAGLSVSALFILGHDAAHGALFNTRKKCDFFGKFLMLPSLHAYSAWVLGHNRVHHSFTIKQEKDFVWHPYSVEEYAALPLHKKLMHKLEWSAFGAGVYYLFEIWWKKMFYFNPPGKLAEDINKDKKIVFAFLAFTVVLFTVLGFTNSWSALYTLWGWTKIIVLPWLAFNYIIGATVHIHHIQPDIAWHSDGIWSKFKGQVEGTTNYRIPKVLNVFFHNIFVHIPHHVDPRIPFYNLPEAAEAIRKYYRLHVRDQRFRFRDYWKATRLCKLYDFERRVWLDYRGRVSAVPVPDIA